MKSRNTGVMRRGVRWGNSMRVLFIALFGTLMAVCGAVGSRAVTWEIPGLLSSKASAMEIDRAQGRAVFRGAAEVTLTDQKTKQKVTFQAPEIMVLGAKAEKDRDAFTTVDRIILRGGPSRVVSVDQGLLIEASDITIVAPKTKGEGILESASAKGGAHMRVTRKTGPAAAVQTLDIKSDSLEISEMGDKAIFTGSVVVSEQGPDYTSSATADIATVTGLLPKGAQPAQPMIVLQDKPQAAAVGG